MKLQWRDSSGKTDVSSPRSAFSEEACPFVRGKRSHGSDIPVSADSCKLFCNPYLYLPDTLL
ncbi:hypothetical protein HUG20_14295 [Salicibibacter cibi]|uniref:Uncharacterized protein n=1 Tax=Salicibibacter cibi TaxID=2743001 RepID=A0A7T6ZCM3_9BACI|nr:hypothetical protein [Salicibibacter cibi]QQK80946.1 hypothetical protein HUG20_14295 [Salicibibacter cibi]